MKKRNFLTGAAWAAIAAMVLSCATTPAATPENAGAFLDRGIAFAMRGDYETAIAEFTEALTLDGNLTSAYMLRGRALRASVTKVYDVGANFSGIATIGTGGKALSSAQRGAFDRAIADYTQALRLDPDNADAYLERGDAYANIGDPDKAIADYTAALRIDPNFAAAYVSRGLAYGDKGMHDRAIEDYTAALRIDPNLAVTYNNRGLAYYKKGMNDRAIEDYNAALRIDPNFAAA
jgi:tetratricopeptide (TPR) repeat protein